MPDRCPTMALAAVDGRKSRVDLEKWGKGRPQPDASVYGREMGWLDVQLRVSVAMTRRHSLLSWLETPSVAKGKVLLPARFISKLGRQLLTGSKHLAFPSRSDLMRD